MKVLDVYEEQERVLRERIYAEIETAEGKVIQAATPMEVVKLTHVVIPSELRFDALLKRRLLKMREVAARRLDRLVMAMVVDLQLLRDSGQFEALRESLDAFEAECKRLYGCYTMIAVNAMQIAALFRCEVRQAA